MWGNGDFLLVEAESGEGSVGERPAASAPTLRPNSPRPERLCTCRQVSADACAVIQSTACLRDTSQVPRAMPDALDMLFSSHTSSVPRRARDTRRVSASALPVYPHLALRWSESRPCPRFPSPVRQVTPPFPYPALRREPVRMCVFCLGSRGCCSGTCLPPRRLAGSLNTPNELNLKRRATRAQGHRCKRTRRSSAHVPFIPRGVFLRGLEPEGPGWETCVSALRVFAGAVVTATASEVA